MTAKEFLDKQYHISVAAGMNQRIHQAKASWWTGWDRACKIIVALLAVASLCLSLWAVSPTGADWGRFSIVISALGALAAIALNVLPLGDWASRHNALFQRWSDMREDVDSILFDVNSDPTATHIRRLKELDAKFHRICGSEPKCRPKVVKHHYAMETKSRQPSQSVC